LAKVNSERIFPQLVFIEQFGAQKNAPTRRKTANSKRTNTHLGRGHHAAYTQCDTFSGYGQAQHLSEGNARRKTKVTPKTQPVRQTPARRQRQPQRPPPATCHLPPGTHGNKLLNPSSIGSRRVLRRFRRFIRLLPCKLINFNSLLKGNTFVNLIYLNIRHLSWIWVICFYCIPIFIFI